MIQSFPDIHKIFLTVKNMIYRPVSPGNVAKADQSSEDAPYMTQRPMQETGPCIEQDVMNMSWRFNGLSSRFRDVTVGAKCFVKTFDAVYRTRDAPEPGDVIERISLVTQRQIVETDNDPIGDIDDRGLTLTERIRNDPEHLVPADACPQLYE